MFDTTGMDRRLRVVLFADVTGYTRLSAESERVAIGVAEALRRISSEVVPASEGRVVKHLGDGVMAVFDGARNGVLAALGILERFEDDTLGMPGGPYQLRVGLHTGEVSETETGDLYGDAVNRAARIQSAAEPDEVLVSGAVHRLLERDDRFRFQDRGIPDLKGLASTMPVYRATRGIRRATARPKKAASQRSTRPHPLSDPRLRTWALAMGSAVAIVAFLFLAVSSGAVPWIGSVVGGLVAPSPVSSEALSRYFLPGSDGTDQVRDRLVAGAAEDEDGAAARIVRLFEDPAGVARAIAAESGEDPARDVVLVVAFIVSGQEADAVRRLRTVPESSDGTEGIPAALRGALLFHAADWVGAERVLAPAAARRGDAATPAAVIRARIAAAEGDLDAAVRSLDRVPSGERGALWRAWTAYFELRRGNGRLAESMIPSLQTSVMDGGERMYVAALILSELGREATADRLVERGRAERLPAFLWVGVDPEWR